MSTFTLDIETLELPGDITLNAWFSADIKTDADGTFFDLESLTSDGKTVKPGEWQWGAMCEWIAVQSLRKFSSLHEAMIAASSPDARAAAYADHVRSQRAA